MIIPIIRPGKVRKAIRKPAEPECEEVTPKQMAGFLDRDLQNAGRYPWPSNPIPCWCDCGDGIILLIRSPERPGKVRYFESEADMRAYLRSGEECCDDLMPR